MAGAQLRGPCKTRAVWVPRSADELLGRLGAGDLHESALLDGKRRLTGGPEVVVDVCAMTVNGGGC